MFRDRTDAGERLAKELEKFKDVDAVVFALPRGGVATAAPIARALGAPLDLILVRKIGAPFAPEIALGAIADCGGEIIVRNEELIAATQVSEAAFEKVRRREVTELARRRRLYLGDRPRQDARGRVAIVVDDGVATGATTRAALLAVRSRQPKKLVLATPIAPINVLDSLRAAADEIVCLEAREKFGAIGSFYRDFRQLSDDDVIAILNAFAAGAA